MQHLMIHQMRLSVVVVALWTFPMVGTIVGLLWNPLRGTGMV